MFLDELVIKVRAGKGGNGCDSYFYRIDHKRLPNGGDGGDGGDVIVCADKNTGSLLALKSAPSFEAQDGESGGANGKYGRKGKDCVLKVPCGTTVYSLPDHLLVRDFLEPDQEVVVLKGGQGGYGNHSGKPRTSGQESKEIELLFSLKIPADIFLVGLPGAGKTSLLKYLSNANVAVGTYPFSTKTPQLGSYESPQGDFRICDLPSVYEGSHEGRGHGTRFLKHLERAKLLFLMLEPESPFMPDLESGVETLLRILGEANPDFLSIKRFWLINKTDQVKKKDFIQGAFPEDDLDFVFPISVKTGTGIDKVMKKATTYLTRKKTCAKN